MSRYRPSGYGSSGYGPSGYGSSGYGPSGYGSSGLGGLTRYIPDFFQERFGPGRQTANPVPFSVFSPRGSATSGWFPSWSGTPTTPSRTSGLISSTGSSSTMDKIKMVAAYFFAIILVALVILIFIDRVITPIFILHPGDPGLIPVPWTDDGVIFWKDGSRQIQNNELPIKHLFSNYSLFVDIFIQNPMQFSTYPRILFSRGKELASGKPVGDNLLSVLTNYNLTVALLPDTTDLLVSVLNKNNNMENAIIPNISVQEPFRLGIVVMDQALEVYINGHLMKTRSFEAPPKDVKGDIYPAAGTDANIAKFRNLKIWSRILQTPEMRSAKPDLTAADEFGAGPIPGSSTCATTSDGSSDGSSNTTSWSFSNFSSQLGKISSSISAQYENLRS